MRDLTCHRARRAIAALALTACAAGVFAPAAQAQAGPYILSETIPLNASFSCTTPQVRTITVADSFTITDLNVGIVADHVYRRDIRLEVRSPAGTTVRLINGPAGGSGADDLNVLLDQASTGGTINNDTGNHESTQTPYQFTRRPDNSLNSFNGQAAQGNWTITLCDTYPSIDDGSVSRVQLLFNNFVPPTSDLSLALSVDDTGPDYGNPVTYTVTLTNGGPDAAPGLSVDFALPSGVDYVSDNGSGAYDAASGLWTLPSSLASGASVSLQVTGIVLTSGSYAGVGEIASHSGLDPDSTPANRATSMSEDDTAYQNITPGFSGTPGVPPTLTCRLAQQAFDWTANAWPVNTSGTATSETRAYPGGGSDGLDLSFAFTGDYNRRIAIDGFLTPYSGRGATTAQTYGTTEDNLIFGMNTQAVDESVLFAADLGTPGIGVEALQVQIHDIDAFSGQFVDRIIVTGFLNGEPVSPILTESVANMIVGDAAIGTATAADTTSDARVTATFLLPVDRFTIDYDNIDPATGLRNQALAISDIAYCPRPIDYGDALSGYPSAGHAIRPGYRIGTTAPDSESGMQASAGADGDDTAGSDDEDVAGPGTAYAGSSMTVTVPASGTGGFLQAWVDWNGDQDFDDAGEQVASDVTLTGPSTDLSVSVPVSASPGDRVVRLRWSTTSGLAADGIAFDGEVEDFIVTVLGAAELSGEKTVSVYDPDSLGLHALPGQDVIYTITVANTGSGPTDADTLFLVDRLPGEVDFWNGDVDSGGPDSFAGTDPVGVVQSNGAAMTFDYATDVGYATGATAPASFAECTTIAPDNTYRSDITFICLRPRGQLIGGDPDPEIAFSFRGRIR